MMNPSKPSSASTAAGPSGAPKLPDGPSSPTPTLPKGGGAIRGIGEKFSANPVTGTGSFSVPIAVSPGRGGMAPSLALSYDSGAGNGLFGLGWQLGVPMITRRTDKGIPVYDDANDSDVYVLSDAEDLVPAMVFDEATSTWKRDVVDTEDVKIYRYRPRIEGLFARIDRRVDKATGAVSWSATTKDNVTSTYGSSAESRIADPAYPNHVYCWLLDKTSDDRGNVMVYEYKAEDLAGVAPGVLWEKARLQGKAPFTNRHLKRVRYGNTAPTVAGDWLFELVFDYGEHDAEAPTPTDDGDWLLREDAFSNRRSGFDIRTYRLCRRVLMFHWMKPDLSGLDASGGPVLVRSTDFTYQEDPVLTKLVSVTHAGYVLDTGTSTYSKKTYPPVECSYSSSDLNTTHPYKRLQGKNLQGLVLGRRGRERYSDLDGEGLPGIVSSTTGAMAYQRNRGNGVFSAPVTLSTQPSIVAAAGGAGVLWMDVDGNSRQEAVVLGRGLAGYHERTAEGGWAPFMPFQEVPNVDWNDPNLRFIDLDGDGIPDVVLTEHETFRWYPSQGTRGFGPAKRASKPIDDDGGPTIVFREEHQSIFLADMTGDGLTDIVRIRNESVCYWPNLGHGKFGSKVTMGNQSTYFDRPNLFNSARIRLADVDGSGTTDVLYLSTEGLVVYRNCSGNKFADRENTGVYVPSDAWPSAELIDLLGTGTACVVWTSVTHQDDVRYAQLLLQKPHLLTEVKNNLGATTRVEYTPSTKYYLEDQEAGSPWATRLPFPVQCVSRVEVYDAISKHRFVSTYRYKHGYYDGVEREFRGFGLVEQWDTESFGGDRGKGLFPGVETLNEEGEFERPPVHTKTWFHTGAWVEGATLSKKYEAEYFLGDSAGVLLADTILPSGLTAQEAREACRALKGSVLRQEVYADDGTALALKPFTVAEKSYTLRVIQPKGKQKHAVFLTSPREVLESYYERNDADPRVMHAVSLEVDAFGFVTKSAAVAYPRRTTSAHAEQNARLVTLTESTFFHAPTEDEWYRLGVPIETRTYELTGVAAPSAGVYGFDELVAAVADVGVTSRLLSDTRQTYWADDLTAALAWGEVESLALPHTTYAMALTPAMLDTSGALEGKASSTVLEEGGYVQLDETNWWVPSGHQTLDADLFYQPVEVVDPFGNTTGIDYDDVALFAVTVTDALGNVVSAEHDYRVLSPKLVVDPNGNRGAVAFDELGMVVASAVMGKVGDSDGDTLEDPTMTLEYDLFRFLTTGLPAVVHTRARETHQDSETRWQESYSYSDGMGREVTRKVQAEPGLAPERDETGALVHDDGELVLTETESRWVGTGRTVVDNKGNPVKQYEPFFSATFEYEDEADLVEWGVTPVMKYDALGRLVRADLPNGTFRTTTWDAWSQTVYDENDTVLESTWYADRVGLSSGDPEKRAATLTADVCADTPKTVHLDVLGRPFLTVDDNGTAGTYETRQTLDIEGNVLVVTDARGNAALTTDYGMLGQKLREVSNDAGTRWMVANAVGKLLRKWDERGHTVRPTYDELLRGTGVFVQEGASAEVQKEKVVYGESVSGAEALNLRGKVYQAFDQAGVVTNEAYDFKGNLLSATRQLVVDYAVDPDWSASTPPTLETEVFSTATAYDALNRPTSVTTPDASEIKPTYNEAGLLEAVDVHVRGDSTATSFVADIDYNAKGQREAIVYGNGTTTEYSYDPLTFRLTQLVTTRTSPSSAVLQDLTYTYDPVGNIMAIADAALQAVFFNHEVVTPSAKYEYDAIYRLTKAEGREHGGTGADVQRDNNDVPIMNLPHENDSAALRNYTELFEYDQVGNILKMVHQAGMTGSWTRGYKVGTTNNRLEATSLPGDDVEDPGDYSATYDHDVHGNMTAMPHLAEVVWDWRDQMRETDLGGGGTAYFVYGADGQRVRKVWEHAGLVEERIYVGGGWEVYRKRDTGGLLLERETLHVMDDQQRIAMVETKTVDTAVGSFTPVPRVRFQLGNHLGSALLEVDDVGAVISYEEYHPYGTSAYRSGDGAVEVSARRYRYTGKERDEETGLYYHGARYYACWLGRWTSADPAGLVDGTDLYEYVSDAPVIFHDSNGREKTKPFIILGPVVSLTPRLFGPEVPEPESKPNPTLEAIRTNPTLQGLGGAVNGTIRAIVPPLMLYRPPPPSKEYADAEAVAEASAGILMLFAGGTGGQTGVPNGSEGTAVLTGSLSLLRLRGELALADAIVGASTQSEAVAVDPVGGGGQGEHPVDEGSTGQAEAEPKSAKGAEQKAPKEAEKRSTKEKDEAAKDARDSAANGRVVTNSGGQDVFRTLVSNEDELLAAAEKRAGGSLDSWTEYKPNWWRSPDGKTIIEFNLEGHANVNEGPHVTVRKFDGQRHHVVEKIFIEGRETFR